MTLNKKSKVFIVYIDVLKSLLIKISISFAKKLQIAFLLIKKVIILDKYLDYLNIFLVKTMLIQLKQIIFNQHIIKLEKYKQQFYKPIYTPSYIKVKTLKT